MAHKPARKEKGLQHRGWVDGPETPAMVWAVHFGPVFPSSGVAGEGDAGC